MNATKLIFSVLLFPVYLHAQEIRDLLVYDTREVDKFLKSTTYVVLDQHEESDYSLAISDAVKKYWNITPFEIINKSTYIEYQKDKAKSFLTREFLLGDKDLISLSLFMGGQRGMERNGKILATIQLKHYSATDEDFVYKMANLVQNIQWQVRMIKDHNIRSAEDYENYYKRRTAVMQSRKLYILQEYLSTKIESFEKIKKFYRHDVSLVDREQVAKAINDRDSTIAYLSIVAPVKNWKGENGYYRIVAADSGENLLYYIRPVSNSAPYGVTGYDLKLYNK